jgi:hypothetical protein
MIAAPGATCGAPKRGWNGWSKPSRPQEGRANAAMPRERAKSSPKRGASWRCDEHAYAKPEQRILRKACSGALRRSEFVSRASSMSSTCSGRQLATTASSRCWRPGARGAGTCLNCGHAHSGYPWKGHRPALPRSRSKRHIQAGSLPPAAFPECSGSGPWRVDAQAWQNRTSINRQRALLTAPVPHWQAGSRLAVTGSSIQGEHLLGRWWKTQNVTQRPHCAGS